MDADCIQYTCSHHTGTFRGFAIEDRQISVIGTDALSLDFVL